MKRITLILGVVAVMVAMLVALSVPAMAKDNGGGHNNGGGKGNGAHNNGGGKDNGGNHNGGINRLDNRLDRLDNRLDFDRDVDVDFVGNFDPSPAFISTNNVNSCWVWNGQTWVWVCASGTEVLNSGFDVDRNLDRHSDFDRTIDVDFDRDIDFSHGNAHHNGNGNGNGNGNAHHNGGDGQKGHGK